jgi:uncharacterized membrane protein YcfT
MSYDESRVAWVDYAKGFCIVMVVMMHSVLGVEKAVGAEGWLHAAVTFAAPFRMPDFFLIAGLFLARTVDRPWRTYLDRKVVHFAWLYVLWLTIQLAFKAPTIAADGGATAVVDAWLFAFVEPFGTMWFIYILPVMFVAAKAARRVPWWLVWLVAAALQLAPIHTGWTMIDEFAGRFVYFYSGYIFAPAVFRFAVQVLARGWAAAALLAIWAAVNGAAVAFGVATLPGVGLLLGFAGATAVVAFSALLSKSDLMAPLRYCGRHSLVIYLAFFLPMAASRTVLLKLGVISDVGTISLLVTVAAVIGPLLLYWAVRNTPLRILFARPEWAHIPPRRQLVPAE